MQVSFNNINKMVINYSALKTTTKPNDNLQCNIYNNYIPTFQATQITKPVMSTKINNEKARMLKKINEILKTNIPVLNEEQLLEIVERRAIAIIKMKNKKRSLFELELEAIYNSSLLSPQQKFNRICQIEKEEKELDKINPFAIPDYIIPKETKENYDYKLLEKFKLALNDNNFDLRSIYQEHYSQLNEIETVEELKKNFPSIAVPISFEDATIDKIIKTLPKDIYLELDKAVLEEDCEKMHNIFSENLLKKVVTTLYPLKIEGIDYYKDFFEKIKNKFIDICATTIRDNKINNIPIKSTDVTAFTNADLIMYKINYDKFVLHVLREHYLNGKKLNEITYTENGETINLTDLKGSDYKFEKFSENIKKFITDSEKIKQYQREYLKLTKEELKERLLYYEKTDFGYDDELFNLFAEFESCKFTEEDKNNLIILLKELDKISDGKKTLEDGKAFLKESNIRPHGTNKINEAEKKEARAQIRAEQLRNEKLTAIRNDFNIIINKMYEAGLVSEADSCIKYYPINSNPDELNKTESVINFIKNTINNCDKKTAQSKFIHWETYNEYLLDGANSPEFKDAKNYAKNFSKEFAEDIMGQYLINRNIVEGYPESAKLFSDNEMLNYIMTQVGKNKDIATILLCKYENYSALSPKEKSSILNILKIFDFNNAADRIPLKLIIENDYINQDTSIIVKRGNANQERTICDTAKQQLFDKHNFPNSVPYFDKFEQALPLDAPFSHAPGVKKLTSNHKKKKIEIAEIKISGHDDRLIADNYDYRFERYDPVGIH